MRVAARCVALLALTYGSAIGESAQQVAVSLSDLVAAPRTLASTELTNRFPDTNAGKSLNARLAKLLPYQSWNSGLLWGAGSLDDPTP
jgi:hypothetical protein